MATEGTSSALSSSGKDNRRDTDFCCSASDNCKVGRGLEAPSLGINPPHLGSELTEASQRLRHVLNFVWYAMSVLGHKRTSQHVRAMSALPQKRTSETSLRL